MTTSITINPIHAVHIVITGESEIISDILEAGSPSRTYNIWGNKILTVKEIPNKFNT